MIRIKHYFKNFSFAQKNILVLFLFAFLATVLIFSWFRNGHLYGGGDVGIPSYDPNRILNIARFVWWEVSAPGTTVPHGLTSIPFQFIQATLQNLGLSYVTIQALFFWTVLFLSGWGMYLVGKATFGEEKALLSFLVGFFYLLNPYMMIQIWHRFIHNTMFLMAGLPFFYLYFRKWIQEGKFVNLLFFLIINFLAVYIFGTLAFIVTILMLYFYTVIFEAFIPWKSVNYLKRVFLRFFVGILFLFLINSWWILPVFRIIPFTTSTQHSTSSNLSTLMSISKQAIVPFSTLGINPFYLYSQQEFGEVYLTPIFLLLPWLMLIFLIPGFFVTLLSRLSKKYVFWPLLWILTIFLIKGTAPPFGLIYEFIFSKFFVLGILRNPYEKLGILLPFSSAILITLGIEWLFNYKGKFKTLFRGFIIVVVITIAGVFLWPMWAGKIFGDINKPAFVEIPPSYKNADNFIANFKENGRILHLPLSVGESTAYNWQYGYSGVESSQLYFNSLPSISRGFNISYIDNSLNAINSSLDENNIEPAKSLKALQDFNVRFIVLHRDIVWQGGFLQNPHILENTLDNLDFLEDKNQFGDLLVYRIKKEYFKPELILSADVQYLTDNYDSSNLPYLIRENDKGNFLSTIDSKTDPFLLTHSSEVVITPKFSWTYNYNKIPIEQIIDEMPALRALPDSPLYPLLRFKEDILMFSNPGQKNLTFKLTFANKRLVEAYQMKKKKKKDSIIPVIAAYQKLIKNLFETNAAELKNISLVGSKPLADIFARQLMLMEELQGDLSGDELDSWNKAYEQLSGYLRENQFLPVSNIEQFKQMGISYLYITQFDVPQDGEFSLVLASQQSNNLYPNHLLRLNIGIDGHFLELNGEEKGQFIFYDKVKLTGGSHEISIPATASINLIQSNDVLTGSGNVQLISDGFEANSTDHGQSFMDFAVKPVAAQTWYEFSFDSWIKKGDKFRVQLMQDTDLPDPKNPPETIKDYDRFFSKDIYNNYWQSQKIAAMLKPTTKEAKIRLLVEPWDDCQIIVVNKKLCKDKKFRFNFEHEAVVVFKNLQLKRIFNNPLFLYSKLNNLKDNTVGEITNEERRSPVQIVGNLRIERPGFLIFKENYHPDWELRLQEGTTIYKPSKRFVANGFGNAWFIERSGNYSFEVEFSSQQLVYKGALISILAGMIVLFGAIKIR